MHGLYVERRFGFNFAILGMLYIVLILSSYNLKLLQYSFIVFALLVYLFVLPKELLNPKNVVFGFYFMWYGIAPLFANRYKMLLTKGDNVKYAYIMFATTYLISMLTLDYYEKKTRLKNSCSEKQKKKLVYYEKVFLLTSYFGAMIIYIYRTGGISKWLTNANEAFFSRKGSGIFYLIFEYAMFLLLFFAGKKRGVLNKIPYLILCVITMYFCGSKSIALIFMFMLFSNQLINMPLLDKKSLLVIFTGISVFVIGMYMRAGSYMSNFESVLSTCLNYFDTFDEFLLLLDDFKPAFVKTIAMPLNWILLKLGLSIGGPYYDTSIWLTTIYYPESWANGGTHQWPLEAYLYLNFHYIFGLPLVICYFLLIAYTYKKAKEQSGVWRFIYLSEIMSIMSHLRGGLLNYWYIYLLPFYLLLLLWEKRIRSNY